MRTQIRIPGDATVDARDIQASITARVKSLESEIQRMSELLASMQTEDPDDERKGRAISDAAWKCKKCSSLLGFYDVQTDVLRIRHKEHSAYIRVGAGGFVQVICRGCGDINTQEYATQDEVEQSQRSRPSPRRVPK